jgi:DNA-binding beta-propeller fold protein YncE
LLLLACVACGPSPDGDEVELPSGSAGIGFDDLRYSAALARVLAPGGRSGNLYLVDPSSKAVEIVGGFSKSGGYNGGHDDGPTSVDEGRGFLFVTDRTSVTLSVVDPKTKSILSSTPLAAHPDYVRFVEKTNELWVSEPAGDQIEIFSLSADPTPVPKSIATIAVDNGPESLVIDEVHGRAYTHHWQKSTVAIDLESRQLAGEWKNGCAASRGIDVDRDRGLLFAVCNEGTISVLDQSDGHIIDSIARGSGYDVMGYDPVRRHLYVAGGACRCLTIFGVSETGHLEWLERFDAPKNTHCTVADDRGNAWICDPDGGSLWRVHDPVGAP